MCVRVRVCVGGCVRVCVCVCVCVLLAAEFTNQTDIVACSQSSQPEEGQVWPSFFFRYASIFVCVVRAPCRAAREHAQF